MHSNKLERLLKAQNALGITATTKIIPHEKTIDLLNAILKVKDRVCIEGNNQKQADFLAKALSSLDPQKIHDLHMLQSVVSLPEHIDLFEKGIASKLDFSYSGPESNALLNLVNEKRLKIDVIHTYIELYARYFTDLTPHVALIAAESSDAQGNLYLGANTEETPIIVEATAFRQGIVIAQVNAITDTLPRVDIPGGRIDYIIQAPSPYYIEPLFTRDPAEITEIQILMAMMVLKGIYAKYQVKSLNHGIGFDTAAIELILPTYGESLGLKGKCATHWALNPHPTLIPAIEAGFVQSIHCFGGELGMEEYVRSRPDIFFVGKDGALASNRIYCQLAGLYACDLFIGSTLQIDLQGNSSTATIGRITGFGGAPNLGSDPTGRRHYSPSLLKAGHEAFQGKKRLPRGRKLVVQIVETFGHHMEPHFVEELDALKMDMTLPPVMIYGEEVSHIVTEEGIANLLLCKNEEEREHAIRGVAGYTPVGLGRDKKMVENLRDRGVIQRAQDLGIQAQNAKRDLLAARHMKDLVRISGGKYRPPSRFRSW